jgi:hypothetical protein
LAGLSERRRLGGGRVAGALRAALAHALPSEVLPRGARDGLAQIVVRHARYLGRERRGQRRGGGRGAHLVARGRALGRVDGSDAEAQRLDVDAARA